MDPTSRRLFMYTSTSQSATVTVTEAGWNTGFPTFHNLFGYEAPPYTAGTLGSVSPTTFNGAGISALYYYPVSSLFYCALAGVRPQSFFISLTPSGGSTLLTSAASSFSTTATYSLWIWNGVNLTGFWDGAGTSTVIFTY